MKIKYYKLLKNIEGLRLYKISKTINKTSYKSTLNVPTPKVGDYLIYDGKNITIKSTCNDFNNLLFAEKISVDNLLKENIIKEISEEIYNMDIELSEKIKEETSEIQCLKYELDFKKKLLEMQEEALQKKRIELNNLEKKRKNLFV